MEDDDEFGDLYTDVLQPIASSTSSSGLQSQPPPRSEPLAPPIENAAAALHSYESDDVTLSVPSSSSSSLKLNINLNTDPSPTLNRPPSNQNYEASFNLPRVSQDPQLLGTHGFGGVSANLPLDSPRTEVSQTRVLGRDDFNLNTEPVAADDEEDRKFDGPFASNDAEFIEKDDNWGIKVEQGDDSPVIPGISTPQPEDSARNPNVFVQEEISAQGDDSESDSEDDLQIVLNDDHQPHIHHHQGSMAGDGIVGNGDDDDEDEDGDPLVIVSDTDAVHHPPPEEQGWGEDAGQAPESERKEVGESGKANGGVPLAPKIGYSTYGYHPFHSQFKYVRPGATPLPGGPGGPGQVRPPVNVGVGRERGDWKQASMKGNSLQKSFHLGAWGNNGRGFGGDFTLPSQKSIFDVDIDSIEEKPWKYPGNDVTDYFNFGLDEDSWKDYCKQLERLRMESTMKNKAHVHVVGSHPEQEYDPDLPPELAAAAAGIQNPSAENYNLQKPDAGQSDTEKGTSHMRPSFPTGRPIQVDIGSGERLPSIDTRPPRIRDLDTVIEIVLQDSLEDDSPADCETHDPPDNDASGEDIIDDAVEEDDEQIEKEYSDGFPESRDRRKRDGSVRRLPQPNARHDKTPEEESSLPPEASAEHLPGSKANSPMSPSDKFEASYEERQMKVKVKGHKKSHSTSPREGGKSVDDKQEDSDESMEGKDSRDALSFEERVVSDDEPFETEENFQKEKEDVNSSAVVSSGTLDASNGNSMRKLKLDSQVEPATTKEIDDVGYLKAARSIDNSRATGSSRDHQKGYTVADEEIIQDEYSSHARDLKRNRGEDGQSRHRKDYDGNMGTEKNTMMAKRREGSYPHRNCDPYSSCISHVKSEGFDKRRERDYVDGMVQQRGEDPHGRKFGAEDSRKHEHADEMIPRHRGKVREGERSNKDEHLPSRKLLGNGNWRGHHEKDAGLHYREKDDTLKTRYENVDDPNSKRRKNDEHARRGDHFGKDEILQAHRESSRRKRERDESLDHRKRDEQHRRENTDNHRSVRPKDEGWLQRERVERHRERDDRDRSRQSYEDSMSRREREDGRAAIRSGRNAEDKGWIVNERDSSYKDTGRNGDPHKRRDRVEDASSLQGRGSEEAQKDQLGHDEKRSRQEKSTVRSDCAVHASDNRRVHERRPKENSRKSKEFEKGQPNTSSSSKKPQEERSGRNEMAGVIGRNEKGNAGRGVQDQLHTTREKLEGASSDDEQRGSKRGRSKLERWASHKERDYVANAKPSSSLKFAAGKDNNLGAGHPAKVIDEPAKKSQAVDRSRSPTEGKESEVPDVKEGEVKPVENKHLDTVAKLKKRSERFKLPMPSDKDASTIKKLESEPLSSTPGEAPVNSEIKQERPARKRRWTSN